MDFPNSPMLGFRRERSGQSITQHSITHGAGSQHVHNTSYGPAAQTMQLAGPITAPSFMLQRFKSGPQVNHSKQKRENDAGIDECKSVPVGLRSLTIPSQAAKLPDLHHSIFGSTALWPIKVALSPRHERNPIHHLQQSQSRELTWGSISAAHSTGPFVLQQQDAPAAAGPKTPRGVHVAPQTPRGITSTTSNAGDGTVLQIYVAPPPSCASIAITNIVLKGTDVGEVFVFRSVGNRPIRPFQNMDITKKFVLQYPRGTSTEQSYGDPGVLLESRTQTDEKRQTTNVYITTPTFAYSALVVVVASDGKDDFVSTPSSPTRTKFKTWKGRGSKGLDLPEPLRVPPAKITSLLHEELTVEALANQIKSHFEEEAPELRDALIETGDAALRYPPTGTQLIGAAVYCAALELARKEFNEELRPRIDVPERFANVPEAVLAHLDNIDNVVNLPPSSNEMITLLSLVRRCCFLNAKDPAAAKEALLATDKNAVLRHKYFPYCNALTIIRDELTLAVPQVLLPDNSVLNMMDPLELEDSVRRLVIGDRVREMVLIDTGDRLLHHENEPFCAALHAIRTDLIGIEIPPELHPPKSIISFFLNDPASLRKAVYRFVDSDPAKVATLVATGSKRLKFKNDDTYAEYCLALEGVRTRKMGIPLPDILLPPDQFSEQVDTDDVLKYIDTDPKMANALLETGRSPLSHENREYCKALEQARQFLKERIQRGEMDGDSVMSDSIVMTLKIPPAVLEDDSNIMIHPKPVVNGNQTDISGVVELSPCSSNGIPFELRGKMFKNMRFYLEMQDNIYNADVIVDGIRALLSHNPASRKHLLQTVNSHLRVFAEPKYDIYCDILMRIRDDQLSNNVNISVIEALAPTTTGSFTLKGKEYSSIWNYVEEKQKSSTASIVGTERITDAVRALVSQRETAKFALLDTDDKILVPADDVESDVNNFYCGALTKIRQELRKKLGKPPAGNRLLSLGSPERDSSSTSLFVSTIEVYGYEEIPDITPAANSVAQPVPRPFTKAMQERVSTPFYLAAMQGDNTRLQYHLEVMCNNHPQSVVQDILKLGLSLDTGNAAGSTCLHAAAKTGHLEAVNLLLDLGDADPGVQNYKLSTPLHAAAKVGCTAVVEAMMKKSPAAALVVDCQGSTPLMVAVNNQRKSVTRFLLSTRTAREQAFCVRGIDGASLLHIAAKRLDIRTIRRLEIFTELSNMISSAGDTPIHFALQRSGPKAVEADDRIAETIDLLSDIGVDILARNSAGETAAHVASTVGLKQVMLTLLTKAGNEWFDLLCSEDNSGRTPLMRAAAADHADVLRAVLSNKIVKTPSLAQSAGVTGAQAGYIYGWSEMIYLPALATAAENGHSDILREFGGRVNQKAYQFIDWELALLRAANTNNTEIVRYLLDKEIQIIPRETSRANDALGLEGDEKELFGDSTALHVASRKGHLEIVEMLIEGYQSQLLRADEDDDEDPLIDMQQLFGTRQNAGTGKTALLEAISNKHVQTVDELLGFAHDFDIDISKMDGYGFETWFVISQQGVTIPDPTNSNDKLTYQFGESIAMTTKGTNVDIATINKDFPSLAIEETPLHAAVSSGLLSLVIKIHEYDGSLLEIPDKSSYTALHLAVHNANDNNRESKDIIKYLLSVGADPFSSVNHKGETTLHGIARWGGCNKHAAAVLDNIMAVADERFDGVNDGDYSQSSCVLLQQDNEGRSAIEIAADHGSVTVVEWMLHEILKISSKSRCEDPSTVFRRAFIIAASSKYLDSPCHMSVINAMLKEGISIPYDAVPQPQSALSLDPIRTLFTSLIKGLKNDNPEQVLTIPLHQQYNHAGMLTGRLRSCQVLLGLSISLQEVSVRDCPFSWVELCYPMYSYVLESDDAMVQADFIQTQSGVHIQFEVISCNHAFLMRMNPSKRLGGYICLYGDENMAMRSGSVDRYGFVYIDELENLDIESWVRNILDNDCIEYQQSTSGTVGKVKLGKKIWMPMTAVHHHELSHTYSEVRQRCSVLEMKSNPMGCDVFDHYFHCLSADTAPETYILFANSHGTTYPSHGTSLLLSEVLMNTIWSRIVRPNSVLLTHLDIQGVILSPTDEGLLEDWITHTNISVLSNLSVLKYTSGTYGDISVTPSLGDGLQEIRPLASLVTGSNNFTLDLNFITCTKIDLISRQFTYAENTDSYVFSSDEGEGQKLFELEEQKCVKRAEESLQELLQDASITIENYFESKYRLRILEALALKRDRRVANESLDILSTFGKGIMVDVSQFQQRCSSLFDVDAAKGLLEYVKRHTAVGVIRFQNLNFLDDGESTVPREFVQMKLLRGLPCKVIDFGSDNRHVGEIFLATATFSPEIFRSDAEGSHPRNNSIRRNRQSPSASPANRIMPDLAQSGLTPLKYFILEDVKFIVSDTMRKYPLQYLIKLLYERKQDCEADQDDDVAVADYSSAAMMLRRATIKTSPMLKMKEEAESRMKTSLYQDTLNVLRKTINYLNSRDPCHFLHIPRKKCEQITPLRLAIHFGLDEVVECMIGQQKAQGGLLKRSLCYEPERLEMDHYVDIWGCKERDIEGLLPIHASLLYIGVTDYDDNVAFGGRWDVVGSSGQAIAAPRHKQPYHIRTGATAAGFFTRTSPSIPTATPSPKSPSQVTPGEASFVAFSTAISQLRHDQLTFKHPSFLISGMTDVTVLHRSDRLATYLDTSMDLEPDVAKLGIRVFRHVRVAKQLIACSFMERSISVSGNPPPRGCKQYLEVPPVVDAPGHSYFATSSGCTERLVLSRTWDRMGVNDEVHTEYAATTLLIALKFAPYCLSNIMRWGDAVELFPKATLPIEYGETQLQHRRDFKSINIINDEPMLGQISWEEVDSGMNLIHWAAARDQKRLLERAVNEFPGGASVRTQNLERTAMHYSCYAGSIECLNILIHNPHVQKNDIHSLDIEGNTPLHIAASLCHPICIEPLLEAGAKPYWRNKRVSGSVDAHDCSIALLLHHTYKEKGFYKENLSREWDRDYNILRDQITLLNKDPRIQRKLSLQATKIFVWEATFYFLFLAVLCMVAHNKTNLFHPDAFFLIEGFRGAVTDEELHFTDSPFSRTLVNVGDTEELHDWLAGPFVDLFHKIDDDQIGPLTVVGSVRLRQLRVKPGSCSRPSWLEKHFKECYGSWTSDNELSGGFHQESKFEKGKADPSLYGWASQMDINYPNSGFVIDIPVSNITSDLFRKLENDRWVDLQTRALFVEFNVYNPSAHRFLNTRILFEITNYGGCHSSMRLTHIRLESCVVGATSKQLACHSLFDKLVFILELCLLVSVLILTYDEACDVWESWLHVNQSWKDDDKRLKKESKDMEWLQQRAQHNQRKLTRQQRLAREKEKKMEIKSLSLSISKKVFNVLSYIWIGLARYFWRDWNLVDLLSVLMFWLVVGTRASYISATITLDTERIVSEKDTFFELWEVAALTVAERELWALVLVLYFVKLLKYIMILPKLGSVANAITSTIGDSKVLIFFVVFMVISMSLMLGLHLLLGTTSDQFKSFKSTILSFTQIVFGQWDYSAFQDSWLVGPLLFMLTLFLANLVLINVFIAVVGNIYEENLKKSVERWSWQIIDHYQYQLTRIPKPRGTGNPVMVLLGKIFRKIKRRIIRKREDFREALENAFSSEEFPARIMRKEAVIRLLKTRQRIQTSLAEVYENVDGVKHSVQSTSSSLDIIHEQLDKLDSSLHQLHSAQDELRKAVIHSSPAQPLQAFGFP